MAFGVAAAVAFNAGNQALLHLAAAQDASSSLLTGASVHLAQEGLLAALLPCMLVAALWGRPGAVGQLFRAQWDGRAVRQTLIACAVVFPVADPLLYSAAAPAVQVRGGGGTVLPGSGPLAGGVAGALRRGAAARTRPHPPCVPAASRRHAWQHCCNAPPQAILGAAGAPASSAFVDAVHAAGQQGAGGALALHLAASGLVGPVWEEVRGRAGA